MNKLVSIIKLLRPEQWLKNGFIFLPLFFGGHLFNVNAWIEGIITFIAFSFMASAVYCLNDIKDVEADRQHPRKCRRPVASGAVSRKEALIVLFLMIALSLCMSAFCLGHSANVIVSVILLTYLVLNIAYCYKLKYIGIIDVFIVSFGFVLRLFAGGVSENIELSPWIVLMTFLLALFLAFAKRRDDVIINEKSGEVIRRSTREYNVEFMNATLVMIASVTMVCYIIYSVSPDVIHRLHSNYVYISSIFVLAGLLRYLQVTLVWQRSGSPTKVLMKDTFIKVVLICWILFFVVILYF